MILTSKYRVIVAESFYDWAKERAFMIDPQGKVHSCGEDHETCGRLNPDLFQREQVKTVYDLIKKGWGKIGWFPGIIYLDVNLLTNPILKATQDLAYKFKMQDKHRVNIITEKGGNLLVDYKNFKHFESLEDIRQYQISQSMRKISRKKQIPRNL